MHGFGLTPAEYAVALAVSEGHALDRIAAERSVSIHTVRNQIKAAMSKLEVNRQIDLVRLVERLQRTEG